MRGASSLGRGAQTREARPKFQDCAEKAHTQSTHQAAEGFENVIHVSNLELLTFLMYVRGRLLLLPSVYTSGRG